MNAYNVMTVYMVYRQLEKDDDWVGNTSPVRRLRFFIQTNVVIGGGVTTMYKLENSVLRPEFKEPRVHFAINCGRCAQRRSAVRSPRPVVTQRGATAGAARGCASGSSQRAGWRRT